MVTVARNRFMTIWGHGANTSFGLYRVTRISTGAYCVRGGKKLSQLSKADFRVKRLFIAPAWYFEISTFWF